VPGDDSLKTCCSRIEVESLDLMHHVEKTRSYLEHLGDRQGLSPRTLVVVPSDRGDRPDLRETVENVGRADITGMDDEDDPCERVDSLGSEKTVGVRDNADCALHFAV